MLEPDVIIMSDLGEGIIRKFTSEDERQEFIHMYTMGLNPDDVFTVPFDKESLLRDAQEIEEYALKRNPRKLRVMHNPQTRKKTSSIVIIIPDTYHRSNISDLEPIIDKYYSNLEYSYKLERLNAFAKWLDYYYQHRLTPENASWQLVQEKAENIKILLQNWIENKVLFLNASKLKGIPQGNFVLDQSEFRHDYSQCKNCYDLTKKALDTYLKGSGIAFDTLRKNVSRAINKSNIS